MNGGKLLKCNKIRSQGVKKGIFHEKRWKTGSQSGGFGAILKGFGLKKKLIPQFMGIKAPDKLKMTPNIPKFSSVFHEIQI